MSTAASSTATPPPTGQSLRLAELLGALSYAVDLTEGQPVGHSIRCSWIGQQIGQAMGLDDTALWELYYAILLKDVGCSSNAARICQLYLTDDLAFKRGYKTVDGSLPQALRFVFTHTGLGHSLAERLRALVDIVREGGDITRELIDTRCHTGADIVRRLRFSDTVAAGVQALDEHWNGKGQPYGLSGTDIPFYARVALLAQVIDVHFTAGADKQTEVIRQVVKRSGSWFDPQLVAIFQDLAKDPAFWTSLSSPDLSETVLALEPADCRTVVDEDYLDDIAAAFAGIIDSKSSFTGGHSERVAVFADMVAEELGLEARHRRRLRRAALLHDIGKLAVSNAILDKPGKLDDKEWSAIRRHPVHSAEILGRIEVFADLVPAARGHHERLDGRGYPDGLTGERISLDTRILTVADVFDALSAKRPYRDAMPVADALAIMQREAGTAFDPGCLSALERGLQRLDKETGTGVAA